MSDALSFFQQHVQASQDRTGTSDLSSMHEQAIAAMYLSGGKGGNSAPFSPTSSTFYSHLPAMDKPSINANPMTYSNSALDPNNTTVFVGGLSSLISEDTLKTFFAPFGEIIYVKIPPGKGCGFVQFVRKMDAERAIERMQGFPIGGGRIRLSWGRSQGDKAAAAAAQVVAQTAQMNHLASLASLSSMTPAQLNHLRAGMSNEANETDTQFLQRLAAYTASSNVENRERESLDLQRVASLQHMPAMEQQHRNAQRQAGGALGYPFDQAALHESFPDREQNGFKTSPDGSSDDYLASLIPGLRLDGFEGTRLAPPQQSRSGLTTPMTPDGRNHSQFLSPSGNVKGPLYQSSSIFSPFSPPISPSRFDEGSPSQSASSKEQRHGNASDSN
jgi:RNA recognition motif-containing protein